MRIDAFFLYEGLNKQLSGKFRAACSASATHSLATSQALDQLKPTWHLSGWRNMRNTRSNAGIQSCQPIQKFVISHREFLMAMGWLCNSASC